jgi:hypothetical protein
MCHGFASGMGGAPEVRPKTSLTLLCFELWRENQILKVSKEMQPYDLH